MSIIAGTAIESALGAYKIERSLRFNSADSAYLSRTPASAGNRKTWTLSMWVKRSKLASASGETLFFAYDTGASPWNGTNVYFLSNDKLRIQQSGSPTNFYYDTDMVFRDVGAWYHIMIAIDLTQSTSTNRIKFYVNGSQVSAPYAGGLAVPGPSDDTWVNAVTIHNIGTSVPLSAYFNGYMSDVYLIDGQQLDPTSFGEYNSDTGVWQPKAYTGSYGTNGFYLDFADNSSTTALGYDAAGSNDWTPNNFSVTAGAGNDSMVDVPTLWGTDTGVGGEVRGNYATWNPLKFYSTTVPTLNNGNLQAAWNNTSMFCGSTIACPNGAKTYSEFTLDTANTTRIGIKLSSDQGQYTGGWTYIANLGVIRNTSDTNAQTGLATSGDGTVIGIAVDLVSNTLQFYRNGSTLGTSISIANASDWLFWVGQNGSGSSIAVTANFGQRPFAYTAPSGFKALCTQNLPDPAIADGSDYMNATLWTGNGATQTITTGLANDLVWTKDRGAAYDHTLFDVLRTPGYFLRSNSTSAEEYRADSLTAFTSTGFSVGADSVRQNINKSGNAYVSWVWKAGSTGVTNTAGTITSTVSANTTAGFSVVTYTGTGSGTPTVGHGLGVAPSMIFIKSRSNVINWGVGHISAGWSNAALLNATNSFGGSSYFASTAPTSTVFSIQDTSVTNIGGATYVAYCFAPVSGYSAFGSYTGNGSTDGPFVYTGFRPRWLMFKRTDTAASWVILDSARLGYNQQNALLYPNLANAEDATIYHDILSNGFKPRTTTGNSNASGSPYIYAAFAESPFKYSLGR